MHFSGISIRRSIFQIMSELCIKLYMLLCIIWVWGFHIVINGRAAEGILEQCVLQLWQRARLQLGRISRAYQAYVWISFAAIRKDHGSVKVISPQYSTASARIRNIYSVPWTAFNVKRIGGDYSMKGVINNESSSSTQYLLKVQYGPSTVLGCWLPIGLWLIPVSHSSLHS